MKSNLVHPKVTQYHPLRFSGESSEVKAIEKTLGSSRSGKVQTNNAHLSEQPQKMGFFGRLGLGMENLGNLYSAGRLNTMSGKAMLAADVLFFMMSFVPLMHFMFLLQPSVIVFLMGAVFKKKIGNPASKI